MNKGRSWLWAGLGLVLFIGLLAALPEAIRYGLRHALENRGAGPVSIEDVDFNPFTGRLLIEGVQLGDGPALQARQLGADIQWWPLWQHHIQLRSLALDTVDVDLEARAGGGLQIGDWVLAAGTGGGDGAWGIGVDGVTVHEVKVRYRSPVLSGTVQVHDATIGAVASWEPHQAGALNVEAAVDGGALTLRGYTRPFTQPPGIEGQLRVTGLDLAPWSGLVSDAGIQGLEGSLAADLSVSSAEYGDGRTVLTVAGLLNLTSMSADIEDVSLRDAAFVWKGEGELGWGGERAVSAIVNGRVDVPQVSGELPGQEVTFSQRSLVWDGRIAYDGTESTPLLNLRGQLGGEQLTVTFPAAGFRITQRDLAWNGTADYASTEAGWQMKADLTGGPLEAVASYEPLSLLELSRIGVLGIDVAGLKRISVGRLETGKARILQQTAGDEDDWLMRFSAGAAEDLKLTDLNNLSVETAWLQDLQAWLHRDKQGRLTVNLGPLALETREEPAEAPPQAGLDWSLGHFETRGTSRLSFEDRSVTPVYRVNADDMYLYLGPLNSAEPGQDSRVEFKASPGGYTKLAGRGTIRPLAERPTVDARVQLEAMDLHTLTPYTASELGYEVKSGQLDADVDLRIDQGEMNTDGRLAISKLKLEALPTPEAKALGESLGMPLDAALSLLRDGNGNIKLKLPVTGDVRNPQFDFKDAINQALVKAMKTAILSYYQPLGALVTVTKLAGKAVALRFNPVVFTPGHSTLSRETTDYLNKMATLLRERPETQVLLCGQAVPADSAALTVPIAAQPAVPPQPPAKEALLALAQKRAEAVRDYLVVEGRIPVGRLILCAPEVVGQADAEPRVEMGI